MFPKKIVYNGKTYVMESLSAEEKLTKNILDNSVIVNTRGFGEDQFGRQMIDVMNLSTEIGYDSGSTPERLLGNFDHNDEVLLIPWTGETLWGAVSKFQFLEKSDYDYMKSIQPKDYDIDSKMNWFWGDLDVHPSRPYWKVTMNGVIRYVFGTMVFGHSRVRVESDGSGKPKVYEFPTYMPNIKNAYVRKFYKVVGFRKYMKDLNKYPVKWLLDNAFVQVATQANARPVHNTIVTGDRGIKLHPVWDKADYPANMKGEYYIWADSCWF